ncbi:MAG: hypothetical protein J0M25_13025 [Flavobacteriales bacterium]|nr:hypothetical protein [Flavobacteriales bacterium]
MALTKSVFYNGVEVGKHISTGDVEKDIEIASRMIKDKGVASEITLVDAILRQARSFGFATQLIFESGLTKSPHNPNCVMPFVVNGVFSIELYLKCLGQINGQNLTGHRLLKLYGKLPQEVHELIASNLDKFAQLCELDKPNFTEYLKKISDAFIKWRYAYEQERTGTIYVSELIVVIQTLDEVCKISKHNKTFLTER